MEVLLDEGFELRYVDVPAHFAASVWLRLGRFTFTGRRRGPGHVEGYWMDRLYRQTGAGCFTFDHVEIRNETRAPAVAARVEREAAPARAWLARGRARRAAPERTA